MHTSYFLWLKNVFGFEETPDIIHFIAYKHAPYLKTPIERYLKKRFEIKKQRDRKSAIERWRNLSEKDWEIKKQRDREYQAKRKEELN